MNANQRVLINARKKIENIENWIQGAGHRRKNGRDCYCAAGALPDKWDPDLIDFLGDAVSLVSGGTDTSVVYFNDNLFKTRATKKEINASVLYVYDVAIELAGKAE